MTVQIAVRLPEQLVEDLDAMVSQGTGPENRTAAIRAAIELYVRTARRQAVDEALRRGYTAHPPGESDEWGSLDALSEANTELALREIEREDGAW